MPDKIEHFFDAHGGFFDNAPKKACFLVGLLVQYLINVQKFRARKHSNSEKDDKKSIKAPFMKKLYGLRLDEKSIKKLSFEAQNKLEQYDENYYSELESIIAQYMVTAGSKWFLTNNEISFFFTTGMNLAGLFKTQKEEEQNDGTDE